MKVKFNFNCGKEINCMIFNKFIYYIYIILMLIFGENKVNVKGLIIGFYLIYCENFISY